MASKSREKQERLVKRYGAARLYDTTTFAYVDATQLRDLVRSGCALTVIDAKTGEDVTAEIMAAPA